MEILASSQTLFVFITNINGIIPDFLLTFLDCLRKIIREILTKSFSMPRIETKHEQVARKSCY